MSSTTTTQLKPAESTKDQIKESQKRSDEPGSAKEEQEETRNDEHSDMPDTIMVKPQGSAWPTEYRRVPVQRRINQDLDRAERPNGANRVEHFVSGIMLRGVKLQSDFVLLWEATGAAVWPGLTRWKIGGEW